MPCKLEFQMKNENFLLKPEKFKTKKSDCVLGYNIKTFQKTEPAKTRQVQS